MVPSTPESSSRNFDQAAGYHPNKEAVQAPSTNSSRLMVLSTPKVHRETLIGLLGIITKWEGNYGFLSV
jgi:hypothetical protein